MHSRVCLAGRVFQFTGSEVQKRTKLVCRYSTTQTKNLSKVLVHVHRCPDLPTNHGEASAKAALYRDRFQLLQQRVLRDRHFTKPSFGRNNSATGSCEVSLHKFNSLKLSRKFTPWLQTNSGLQLQPTSVSCTCADSCSLCMRWKLAI